MNSSQITIERHGIEFTADVKGSYVKECRGHRDKYGAPEEPDEPAYLEDVEASAADDVKDGSGSILILKGETVELTPQEQGAAEQAIWNTISDGGFFPEPPDAEFDPSNYF